MIIRPQAGYQELMLSSAADIAIGGGAAGSGKSWVTVADAIRWLGIKNFSSVIFRRNSTDLRGSGSIWEETEGMYPLFRGRPNRSALEWTFPSGAKVKCNHLQHENSVEQHRSKAYAVIHFEELTTFTERQFWFMFSRNRSRCGIRPYMRATCNPDPDSFVAKLIEWWIDQDTGLPIWDRRGVLRWFVRPDDDLVWGNSREELQRKYPGLNPKSFTFIAGRLDENKALEEADPDYRDKLMSLNRVERARLLYGNWKIRAAAGMYFKRENFTIVDEVPGEIATQFRCWDKAASEPTAENPDPDYTAGVKMARLKDGRIIILDVVRNRGTPGKVDRWMLATKAQDGPGVKIGVFQDPGQAGKVDVEHMRSLLGQGIHVERPSKDKVTMAGSFSAYAEHEGILLLRGPWNDAFLREAEAFPTKGIHDDQIDAAAAAFNRLSRRREIHHA